MKRHHYVLASAIVAAFGMAGAASAATVTDTMGVQITITDGCSVDVASTANDLDFGTYSLLDATIDASSSNVISVTCTSGATYDIGLDAGLNAGSPGDTTTRRMNNGSNYVAYDLFQAANGTTHWGDTVGSDTLHDTGSGTAQTYTVYGRVLAQTTPPAGTYNDTVTVTVTY